MASPSLSPGGLFRCCVQSWQDNIVEANTNGHIEITCPFCTTVMRRLNAKCDLWAYDPQASARTVKTTS